MYDETTMVRKHSSSPLHFHNSDVPFLTASSLSACEQIVHGFSTRLGGTGIGQLGSMNLSFHKDEPKENVEEHYRRLGKAIGFDPTDVVCTKQTHTVNIRTVTEMDRGKGFSKPRDYDHVDGLITQIPGLVLTIFSADCVPLLLFDPVKQAIGAAHSGWRGTVEKMGTKMVERMANEFGSNPTDILTAIGPSICQDCYEVSEDVVDRFRDTYTADLWSSLFYPTVPGKFQLNLWEACAQNFLAAGISPAHISKPDLCTACNPQLLYSHRKADGKEGNLGAFIMLK